MGKQKTSHKKKSIIYPICSVFIVALTLLLSVTASAVSTSGSPTAASTSTSIGNVPWTNPNNILTPGSFASGTSSYDFPKLDNPTTLPAGSGNDASFSPNGTLMAVAHAAAPYLSIYQVSGTTLTKLPDSNLNALPPSAGTGVTFSPDGSMLAVTHASSPFLTVYSVSGTGSSTTFTKLADPLSLPAGSGNNVTFSPNGLMLTVAHATSPFVSTYSISGGVLTKLADPVGGLPGGSGNNVAYNADGSLMAVATASSPYVAIYQVSGTVFTRLPNPATLPPFSGSDVKFNASGSLLAVSHSSSPLLTVYEVTGTPTPTFTKIPNPSAIPPGTIGLGVAFSPDGSLLTITGLTSPYVTTYEVKGTTLTKLPNLTTPPLGPAFDVNYSADGSFLAVPSNVTPFINVYSVNHLTVTNYLTASGYGLNVPANATIDGVEISINKNKSATTDNITDNEVRLTPGGAVAGANRAVAGQWADAAATTTYGSPTDKWGLTLTPQQVNDPSFGAAISANVASEAQVNTISMVVYYTLPNDGELADTGANVSLIASAAIVTLGVGGFGLYKLRRMSHNG